MDIKGRVASALLVLALCGPAGSATARAEVSAEIDALGNYLRTVVLSNASVKNPKIWSSHHARALYVPLNPGGDLNGDLYPAIVEDPLQFNHPWVVWSRFDGSEYSLAWSRWSGGWEPIQWIGTAGISTAGNDLDPALTLDPSGRPYVAWWRDEQGVGRVYLSLFLDTRWMDPLVVSEVGVDSRYPSVAVQGELIVVRYETPGGTVQQVLALSNRDSINDDITPFERFDPPPSPSAPDHN
jgi:hypothetical protein